MGFHVSLAEIMPSNIKLLNVWGPPILGNPEDHTVQCSAGPQPHQLCPPSGAESEAACSCLTSSAQLGLGF